jgi:hypothetical protein
MVVVLKGGASFGERALLSYKVNVRTATCVTHTPTEFAII